MQFSLNFLFLEMSRLVLLLFAHLSLNSSVLKTNHFIKLVPITTPSTVVYVLNTSPWFQFFNTLTRSCVSQVPRSEMSVIHDLVYGCVQFSNAQLDDQVCVCVHACVRVCLHVDKPCVINLVSRCC